MTRTASGRLAVGLVLALLGFLVVVQLRSQAAGQGLSQLSVQDLTELVANVTTRNNQLRDEVRSLEVQRSTLAASVQNGDSSAGSIRNDLNRILAWSGVLGVTGAGVRVSVSGPLPASGLNYLINELRNAGAEALSLNGSRLVQGVVADGAGATLTLGGAPLTSPLELLAVGQPETLAGSLSRAGGPIAQLAAQYPEVAVAVTSQDLVQVPATNRVLTPVYGRPRL